MIALAIATGIAPEHWRAEGPRGWTTALQLLEQQKKS